jgi:hypothetical protein
MASYVVWKDGRCCKGGLQQLQEPRGLLTKAFAQFMFCGCPACLHGEHKRLSSVFAHIGGKRLPIWAVIDGPFHQEATGHKVLKDFPWEVQEVEFLEERNLLGTGTTPSG